MEQILSWITQNTWISSIVILPLIGYAIRKIPKQKLMNIVPETAPKFDKMMYGFGVALSVFGTARIGKKAMESIEEGIFQTIIATLMAWATRGCNIVINGLISFGKGFMSDNTKDSSNNDKQNKE